VQDPLVVGGLEGLGDLGADAQRVGERERAFAEALCERRTGHELEDQEAGVAGFLQAVDGGDVGVVEGGQRLGLASEAGEAFRVGGEGSGEDLEGDVAAEPGVAGAVDLAHAAGAKEGDDVEGPERAADE